MNIKELREKSGLPQSKFSEKYHLSLKTLQRWERGQTHTPESILFLLNEIITKENKKNDWELFMENAYLRNVLEEEKAFVVNALRLMASEEDSEDGDAEDEAFLSFCRELRKGEA